MFKMLIVEDERWEREGLIDFLDWNSLGIELSGLACDGIEGVTKAHEIHPDIIITDIKMPGLDGLKMSGKIKEFLPDVKIIVLTGYDDFRLAREAISVNANAYILKPVEENEFLEVMKKVIGECQTNLGKKLENKRLRDLLKENTKKVANISFLDLLKGKISFMAYRQQSFIDILPNTGKFEVLAVTATENEDQNIPEGTLPDKIEEIIKSILIETKGLNTKLISIFDEFENVTYLCISSDSVSLESICLAEAAIINAYRDNCVIKTIIGIGGIVDNIDSLQLSGKQAKEALNYALFRGDISLLKYDALEADQKKHSQNIGEFMTQGSYFNKQLLHSVRASEDERTYKLLDDMFDMIDANTLLGRETIANYLYGIANEIFLILYNIDHNSDNKNEEEEVTGTQLLNIPNLKDMKDYFYSFIERAIERRRDKRNNKDEYIIKKVEQLISTRYNSDISLKTIAADIYLSPNYLGSIFKRNTGLAFNDYLCNFRMEKAKELLKSPKNKVSWVAQEVGITNPSYFCMLFKNTYGVAPGEYQESIIRGF